MPQFGHSYGLDFCFYICIIFFLLLSCLVKIASVHYRAPTLDNLCYLQQPRLERGKSGTSPACLSLVWGRSVVGTSTVSTFIHVRLAGWLTGWLTHTCLKLSILLPSYTIFHYISTTNKIYKNNLSSEFSFTSSQSASQQISLKVTHHTRPHHKPTQNS